MSKFLQEFRGAALNAAENVKMFKATRDHLISEGRTQDWTKKSISEAKEKAAEKVATQKGEMKKALLNAELNTRDLLKPQENYTERLYHLQRAQALAQGGDPVEVYRSILKEPDSREYKNEYESILKPGLEGNDLARFEEIRRNNLTDNEIHFERETRLIESLKKHMQMLEGFCDQAINEIYEQGDTNISIGEMVEPAIKNAQSNMLRDVRPIDKQENAQILQDHKEYESEAG